MWLRGLGTIKINVTKDAYCTAKVYMCYTDWTDLFYIFILLSKAIKIQVTVFWFVTLCSHVVGYTNIQHFGGSYYLHLQLQGPLICLCSTTSLHSVTTQKTMTWNYHMIIIKCCLMMTRTKIIHKYWDGPRIATVMKLPTKNIWYCKKKRFKSRASNQTLGQSSWNNADFC